MKLYFTPKTLKKIIRLLLLFILISIIIFYSKSLNVQAKEFTYTFTSPYVYFWDKNQNSYANSGTIVYDNILYYVPTNRDTRQSINSMSYEINYDRTEFGNSFTSDDLVYFKGIIYFNSFYDVSLVKNFSFIQALTSSLDDLYKIYVGYNSPSFYATIEDFDSYITINSSGEYAYNEILLFSLAVPYSKLNVFSSLSLGISAKNSAAVTIISYGNNYGTIPTTNKNSFMQINQLVISDEEITMSLEDFEDPLNLEHYSSDEVIFPDYEEDVEDDSILGWIKRIFNKILDTFKSIIKLPVLIFDKINEAFTNAFIPSDNFFENSWNANLKLLEEKLGFLFFPFSILEKVLNHFLNLGNGSGIIHIPTIKDPIYSQTLISAQDLNLKQIFSTGAIGTAHDIYLVVIDILIIVGLISLSLKKFNSIFKGGQE